jgi:hypothetical protein
MPQQGRLQDLGDGWAGRFDYDQTSRGWVPVSLHVWHHGEHMPPSGLPVRRLRLLTTAEDLDALGPLVVAPNVSLTPAQRRTIAGRLQALQLYDAHRLARKTRAETARAMHVSEAWLKWVLSWGRQQGYLNRDGEITEAFGMEYVRAQNEGD